MKSTIGVAALVGVLALALLPASAAAQCTSYPGPMIKFDSNGYSYETNYNKTTLISTAGSQLTVVGKVSLFCNPFLDLNPEDPNVEYTFVWSGLVSQGTTSAVIGSVTRYTTHYLGGMFRIYAGTPKDIPGTLPALPAPGVIPDTYQNGTLILEGPLDDLSVIITRTNSTGTLSGSFRTNYHCTGGTLISRVGDATELLSGVWCPVPQTSSGCPLPTGWSAHPNGKWDAPATTAVPASTWGKIKTIYR